MPIKMVTDGKLPYLLAGNEEGPLLLYLHGVGEAHENDKGGVGWIRIGSGYSSRFRRIFARASARRCRSPESELTGDGSAADRQSTTRQESTSKNPNDTRECHFRHFGARNCGIAQESL
jgi:hypothetical protein